MQYLKDMPPHEHLQIVTYYQFGYKFEEIITVGEGIEMIKSCTDKDPYKLTKSEAQQIILDLF